MCILHFCDINTLQLAAYYNSDTYEGMPVGLLGLAPELTHDVLNYATRSFKKM